MTTMKIIKYLFIFALLTCSIVVSAQEKNADDMEENPVEDSAQEFEEEDEDLEWYADEEAEDQKEREEKFKSHYNHYDTAQVELRAFDTTKVNALRQNPELSYGYTQAAMSFWDSFMFWLKRQLDDMFHYGEGLISYRMLLVVIFIAAMTYAVLRLMKVDSVKLFYGRRKINPANRLIIEENIHEMDFEKLLEEAIRNKDYRLTVRLFFLYGLKMLADKQHLYWEPGKTNHDYINELKQVELRNDFNRLNYYFEYAWYGNFTLTADMVDRVKATFTNLKRSA